MSFREREKLDATRHGHCCYPSWVRSAKMQISMIIPKPSSLWIRLELPQHDEQLGERRVGRVLAGLLGRVDELIDLAAVEHDHFLIVPIWSGGAHAGDEAALRAERLEHGWRELGRGGAD